MQDIEHYDIPIYNFPFDAEEDDDDVIAENSELRVRLNSRLDHFLQPALSLNLSCDLRHSGFIAICTCGVRGGSRSGRKNYPGEKVPVGNR